MPRIIIQDEETTRRTIKENLKTLLESGNKAFSSINSACRHFKKNRLEWAEKDIEVVIQELLVALNAAKKIKGNIKYLKMLMFSHPVDLSQ